MQPWNLSSSLLSTCTSQIFQQDFQVLSTELSTAILVCKLDQQHSQKVLNATFSLPEGKFMPVIPSFTSQKEKKNNPRSSCYLPIFKKKKSSFSLCIIVVKVNVSEESMFYLQNLRWQNI